MVIGSARLPPRMRVAPPFIPSLGGGRLPLNFFFASDECDFVGRAESCQIFQIFAHVMQCGRAQWRSVSGLFFVKCSTRVC